MQTAKADRTDAALEAQVFWFKYQKEIAALLIIAIFAILALAGYRFYRERRETAAAGLFASAKVATDYQAVIQQYGDTSAAASAYLLLANAQNRQGKYSEANANLQMFLEKFPQHELASTARMTIAANLEKMGRQDEALATYQQIASTNAGSFNAPMALLAQVHILQSKNQNDDARRICETIMTRYQGSFASLEAGRILRTLKPLSSQTPTTVAPSTLNASPLPNMRVAPTAPPPPKP